MCALFYISEERETVVAIFISLKRDCDKLVKEFVLKKQCLLKNIKRLPDNS